LNLQTAVIVVESALGSSNGSTYFTIDNENPTSPTNKLSSINNGLKVEITTGDDLLKNLDSSPNLIKLDVEGAEIEVLKGMTNVLSNSNLRAIFIEVHSKMLEENGYQNGSQTIETTLQNYGFKTRWTDFSHIEGIRNW
jgi:FkbM family methyltransferase